MVSSSFFQVTSLRPLRHYPAVAGQETVWEETWWRDDARTQVSSGQRHCCTLGSEIMHCERILRLVSVPAKRNSTIWSKLAAISFPILWALVLWDRCGWWYLLKHALGFKMILNSHHQLVEISTLPLGSFTRKESHTDVEVLFGGILAWEFSDVFGGIFTHVWRPHKPPLSVFLSLLYTSHCNSQLEAVVFSQFLSAKFSVTD